MLIKIIFFLSLVSFLYANKQIDNIYYIDSDTILLSDIIPQSEDDSILFRIQQNRSSEKIKSTNLIRILNTHGYKGYTSRSGYIKFIKKSDIDISKIKEKIKEYYLTYYKSITIKKIDVLPRGYIKSLPQKYSIKIPKRAYLSNHGTLNIKTLANKTIYLDYTIDASIDSYSAKQNIKRGTELSLFNTRKNTIPLSKFRALPVESIHKATLQAKNYIKLDNILTSRDVAMLSIVRKNDMVNAVINDSTIAISFSAKAMQDGKHGDTINIQKRDGKRFKAIVIGKNRVEVK